MLVKVLSSTITIARARCGNYVKVVSAMIAENLCQVSFAEEGRRIIDFCLHLKEMYGLALRLGCPTQILSELVMMESPCSKSEFAQDLLVSDSVEVNKACYLAISGVIGKLDVGKSDTIPKIERELSTMPVMFVTCLMFFMAELGGEIIIDLCKQCYDLGTAYLR